MLFLFLDFIGLSFNLKQLTGLLDIINRITGSTGFYRFSSYQCVVCSSGSCSFLLPRKLKKGMK